MVILNGDLQQEINQSHSNRFCREPNIIVAIDGNFQHWRYATIDEDPQYLLNNHDVFFIPNSLLEDMKNHVNMCRKSSASNTTRRSQDVPNTVLDSCQGSSQGRVAVVGGDIAGKIRSCHARLGERKAELAAGERSRDWKKRRNGKVRSKVGSRSTP